MKHIYAAERRIFPLVTDSLLRYRYFAKPNFGIPWHFHPEVEILLLTESSGLGFVGDSPESFGEGDLVVIGPNVPHIWREKGGEGYTRGAIVHLSVEFQEVVCNEIPETKSIRDLVVRAQRGAVFEGETRDRAAAALLEMNELSGLEKLLSLLRVLTQLASSSEVRYLSPGGLFPIIDGKTGKRGQHCYEYIMDHIDSPITLEDVASVAHMSPHSFCRYFKKATGKTLSGFVNEIRIGLACRYLLDTDMKIADICHHTGFQSLSYFNRRFRELLQCSPRQWRQQRRVAR